jgi:hypothetical protein
MTKCHGVKRIYHACVHLSWAGGEQEHGLVVSHKESGKGNVNKNRGAISSRKFPTKENIA